MPSSPKPDRSNDRSPGERSDRVRRACDRCNTSRTRCSGELNYPCQYERIVKKRGPKPMLKRRDTEVNPPWGFSNSGQETPRSPDSMISSGSHDGDYGSLPFTAMRSDSGDWNKTRTESQSPASTSGSYCNIYQSFADIRPNEDAPDCQATHAPASGHFPLALQPLPFTVDSGNDTPVCRYECLDPLIPILKGTLDADDACSLLDIFFSDSATAISGVRCPYILSPIIRKASLLRQTNPRPISPALLAIILWTVSQTATLNIFVEPNSRARVTQRLYFLSLKLLRARDPDNWHRVRGGWVLDADTTLQMASIDQYLAFWSDSKPKPNVDDVISFVLLTCVISGTGYKEECFKWWNKAISLAKTLGLNSETRISEHTPVSQQMCFTAREDHEERRRAFWLVYSLDRHLALSFNVPLRISDSDCQVLAPLPEWIWQNLDTISLEDIPPRVCAPPTQISGTGFFEYFLPLMTHPRLGNRDEPQLTATVEAVLADYAYSLDILRVVGTTPDHTLMEDCRLALPDSPSPSRDPADLSRTTWPQVHRTDAVIAYGRYIIQILHILLHGTQDQTALSSFDNAGTLITPGEVFTCAAETLTAGDSITHLLELDPDLSFMPFLFGIYLFHGSSSFLALAGQMAQIGEDALVKGGRDAIVHTSFQRNFSTIVRQYMCIGDGATAGKVRGEEYNFVKLESDFDPTIYQERLF
ncbi:fungal-specific transcription factor domain-containing protein [Aspergillus spectabilis]